MIKMRIVVGLKDFLFIDYEDIRSCWRAIEAMNRHPFDSFSSGTMKVITGLVR
jgi:hypothetical protein